jgi:hypothetical protein
MDIPIAETVLYMLIGMSFMANLLAIWMNIVRINPRLSLQRRALLIGMSIWGVLFSLSLLFLAVQLTIDQEARTPAGPGVTLVPWDVAFGLLLASPFLGIMGWLLSVRLCRESPGAPSTP